ncbi:hypothetical protein [Pinirhizobacter soli]|uniref:hypothetical protein n=1 Tax=Pinirhizobacter soli TaxID=2786953 RepID=UPI002029CF3D|nr:hypothetical protein [Pinirhizobacter soli]
MSKVRLILGRVVYATDVRGRVALRGSNRCKTKGIVNGKLCAIFALVVSTVLSGSVFAAWPSSADTLSKKLVFAEFHPWAATPAAGGYWLRWNESGHNPALNDILSTIWPLSGPYSEADCATVQKQVGDLSGKITGAGVDVLLIDWANVYASEQDRVSNILSCTTMPAVVMVDVNWTLSPPSFSDASTRLETAIGWFAARQDLFPNYYRDPVSGQPVFFVYDPGTVGTVAQWNAKIDYDKTLSPRGFSSRGQERTLLQTGYWHRISMGCSHFQARPEIPTKLRSTVLCSFSMVREQGTSF